MNTHGDSYQVQVRAHPKWQTELKMMLSPNDAVRLAERLSPVHSKKHLDYEVCLTLTGVPSWTEVQVKQGHEAHLFRIFFKLKDSDNRFLLAHPEAAEWVATVLLDEQPFLTLLEQLRQGQSVRLDQMGPVNRVSNFHIHFEIQ